MPEFAIGQTVEVRKETEHYRRGARTAIIRDISPSNNYGRDGKRIGVGVLHKVKLDKAVAGRALWWLPASALKEVGG